MADVKREKELAERRKNEPQLGSSQDHLVRKIFSKFRRAQQTAQLTKDGSQNSDVEKGDTDQESKKVREESLLEWKLKLVLSVFNILPTPKNASFLPNLHSPKIQEW